MPSTMAATIPETNNNVSPNLPASDSQSSCQKKIAASHTALAIEKPESQLMNGNGDESLSTSTEASSPLPPITTTTAADANEILSNAINYNDLDILIKMERANKLV